MIVCSVKVSFTGGEIPTNCFEDFRRKVLLRMTDPVGGEDQPLIDQFVNDQCCSPVGQIQNLLDARHGQDGLLEKEVNQLMDRMRGA